MNNTKNIRNADIENQQGVPNWEDVGLSLNESGKYVLNANAFSRYILKRMQLCVDAGGQLFLYKELRGVWERITEKEVAKVARNLLHDVVPDIWRRSWEQEYLAALQLEMKFVRVVDEVRHLLNLENGMIDLNEMTLISHGAQWRSTIRIPVQYDPEAQCPRFMQFLREVMLDDGECVRVIQEIMGYCLTSEMKLQKAFFFYGAGSNGKSVLAAVMERLCGLENVSHTPLSTLNKKFGMQELPGKILNISPENDSYGKDIDTQMLKSITGGDIVAVEQKYKTASSVQMRCKLLFLLNQLPTTKDTSYGFYRRLVLSPFDRIFKPEEQDRSLLTKLYAELPGILNFALEGLQRLRQQQYQLSPAKRIDGALEKYRQAQHPVLQFVEELVRVEETAKEKRSLFYDVYKIWTRQNERDDCNRVGRQEFWGMMRSIMDLKQIEYCEVKVGGTMYMKGVSISSDYLEALKNSNPYCIFASK